MDLDERRSAVAQLTRDGASAREIARRLGVTSRTVLRDRGVLGIAQPEVPPISPDRLALAHRLLDDGASYREAARTVDCSQGTLAAHFPGYGWTTLDSARFAAYCRHHRVVLS